MNVKRKLIICGALVGVIPLVAAGGEGDTTTTEAYIRPPAPVVYTIPLRGKNAKQPIVYTIPEYRWREPQPVVIP